MVAFTITASEFEGLTRLDPEYYQPLYRNYTKPLASICKDTIKSVCDIVMGPAYSSKSFNTAKESIPICKIGDVTNKRLISEWEIISNKEFRKYNSITINQDDIVLTMTGDPPDVGKTNMPFTQFNEPQLITFNQRVAKIRGRSIDQYYLYAFLQSEKFRLRIEQVALGIRQRNISIPDLKNAYIFRPSDEKEILAISNLIKKHFELSHLSQSLYTQAQQLLESELGLDKLVFDKPLSYEARLSEVVGNNRADGEYYQPMYLKLREIIKDYKHGFSKLTDIAFSLPPNIDPGKFANTEFEYVELSSINPSLGIIGKGTKLLGKEAPSRARRMLETGDILASAVVGSVDKAAIVDSSSNGKLASTGFFQFRPKYIESEYLLVLIRSKLLTMQLQQEATGGILSAVPDNRLHNVIIPTLPNPLQQKISGLVSKSHKHFHESQQLLEQAKHRVEELIEQAVQK